MFALALLAGVTHAASSDLNTAFERFVAQHRSYDVNSPEGRAKFQVFAENVQQAAKLSQLQAGSLVLVSSAVA